MSEVQKLPTAPNITRVVHQITIQVVELDNDPTNLQVALLNPDQVPLNLVSAMVQDSAKVISVMVQAEKKNKGGKNG